MIVLKYNTVHVFNGTKTKGFQKVISSDYAQEYSPGQLADFTEYCKTTSMARLLTTFALTTLAPLVAVFSVIGWPLDSISKGLSGKNLFQPVQGFIVCAHCCIMFGIRYRKLIPDSILQPRHHIIPFFVFTGVSLTLIITVELTYVYPIPFVCIASGIVGVPCLLLSYVYLEGNNFRKVKRDMKTFVITVITSLSVLVAHELLGVLYTSQQHNPLTQSGVALLLGLLKFILRTFYSWALQTHGEMATGSAIFEVKFFNMLYTSIFTQKTTSSLVLVALLGADAIENLYFLWKLNNLGRLYRKEQGEMGRLVLFKTEYVALL